MSFSDYDGLKSSVASWLARSDLTTNIPDFISLFETEANRTLRVRQMQVTQSTTPSSGVFDLPSDYLQTARLTWTGDTKRDLEYVTPSYLQYQYPANPSSTPRVYTIEGSTDATPQVRIAPVDSTALDFVYYQKITALSTDNTSNWLLAAHPDLYLSGSMTEACVFVKDFDTGSLWKQRRDDQFERITKLDQKTRGPSYIRPVGVTP